MGDECKIDWLRVLSDLQKGGYTLERISEGTSIAISTLKDYRTGTEPRHSKGQRILRLWANCTGHPADTAPAARTIVATCTA